MPTDVVDAYVHWDVAGDRSVDALPEVAALLDELMGRTRTDLGLHFRPLRETLADTIRWWAEQDAIDRELADRLAPMAV